MCVLNCHCIGSFLPALVYGTAISQNYHGLEYDILNSPLHAFYNGTFAVFVFFVLSGYVLTYKFFIQWDAEKIISGAFRRYFRLIIPVSISVFIAYVLLVFTAFHTSEASMLSHSIFLSGYYHIQPDFYGMLYCAFIASVTDPNSVAIFTYNPPLWSIPWEFVGCLFILLITAVFGKSDKIIRYCAYCLCAILTINTDLLPFIFGIAIADIYNSKETFLISHKDIKWLAVPAILFVIFIASYFNDTNYLRINQILTLIMPWITNYPNLLYSTAAAILLVTILKSGIFQKFLSNEILVYCGKLSFSVYLLHFIIICSVGCWVYVLLSGITTYYICGIITILTVIGITFMAAHIFQRYIDINSIVISKEIYNLARLFIIRLSSILRKDNC